MKDNTEIRAPTPIVSLAILLAGSLLVGFSMGRWLAPLVAWIGPVLIMRYARDHKVGRGALLVFAANFLAFAIGFGAMWSHWGLPAVPIFAVLYGILWSLPYLADRLVSPRLRGFSSTLVYPLAATTLEFVNIHANPLGTWGATGFSQYGNLPLMQLASVTGLSMAVDPYGRVLAQTDFFGATDRTMVAQVPVRHVATLYTAFGRWLEWLCVAGFLFIVVGALFARPAAT
jgi:apolipoprotein N-acyltransferase